MHGLESSQNRFNPHDGEGILTPLKLSDPNSEKAFVSIPMTGKAFSRLNTSDPLFGQESVSIPMTGKAFSRHEQKDALGALESKFQSP